MVKFKLINIDGGLFQLENDVFFFIPTTCLHWKRRRNMNRNSTEKSAAAQAVRLNSVTWSRTRFSIGPWWSTIDHKLRVAEPEPMGRACSRVKHQSRNSKTMKKNHDGSAKTNKVHWCFSPACSRGVKQQQKSKFLTLKKTLVSLTDYQISGLLFDNKFVLTN